MDFQERSVHGTGNALKTFRKSGRTPGIVYGPDKPNIMVSVCSRALLKAIYEPAFCRAKFEIELAGQKMTLRPRDIQYHPLTDAPIHIDFMIMALC